MKTNRQFKMADGSYEKIRISVKSFIGKIHGREAAKELAETLVKLSESDVEKKYAVDQALRDLVKESLIQDGDVERPQELIGFAVDACQNGTCSPTLPFILLSDVFDSITLQLCEKLFVFVEEQVSIWTTPLFFSAGKNLLLRMCNDLLRRLSTQQNTVFCGRIQMFLARLFPLSEKSGLNLMSQFNLENVTKYTRKLDEESNDDSSDAIVVDDGPEAGELVSSAPVDYNLYRKFWALQDYFRNPTQCYTTDGWKTFTESTKELLSVFSSHKLEHISRNKKSRDNLRERSLSTSMVENSEELCYFPKFLTNEKLLDLQLSDSNFRRTILVQFIILFQYLTGSVKFKSNNHVLTELQTVWVKDMTDLVYQLLKEIPPDGEKFAKVTEHILEREENWISWKNEGCPSFIKDKQKEPSEAPTKAATRKRTRSLGEEMASGWKSKSIQMGSSELTRLWNLCPNNLEACSSDKRVFLPTLEEFFGDAIEQSDPAAMIEDEYKLIKNSNFGWRALRLLARRSQHFFQPSSNPFKTLPDYLESVVLQLAQELPTPKTEDVAIVENGSTDSNDP